MEEFLIGASLALLLALLAWSDAISTLHKDTLELERDFSQNRKLDLRRIRTIIRTEGTLAKRITALNKLINSAKLKDVEDINIIELLTNLDSDRHLLEKKYKIKFWLVIVLTYAFLISGIINYFIADTYSFSIFSLIIKTEFISIFFCIILLHLILIYVVCLNNFENKYKEKIKNLTDKI